MIIWLKIFVTGEKYTLSSATESTLKGKHNSVYFARIIVLLLFSGSFLLLFEIVLLNNFSH